MFLYIFIGVLCACSLSATSTSSNEEPDSYYPALPQWSDNNDWRLLKAYSNSTHRNVLISPLGLKMVLALLYEGSGGLTEKEFQRELQFPINKTNMRDNYKKMFSGLQINDKRHYTLNLETGIFLDSQVEAEQSFAAKASAIYRTEIKPTNFSRPLEASESINSWVEKLTNGSIKHLIASGDIQDAIMIIANAIYFKGSWQHQFPKEKTAYGGFYVSEREVVSVPYMTTTEAFYYFDSNELDAKILRLPYKGKNYALFIVLPNSKAGLQDLIKKINLHVLIKYLTMLDKVPVRVVLPKFKFDFQTKFIKTLQLFGLKQMFQNTASFPGIARGLHNIHRNLVVSDIVQKSGIEVDEEGSVVYSATEVHVGNKFGEVDYVFNASHPFMFFLEEKQTGTILFVGKVENPLEGDAVPQRFGEDEGSQPSPLDVPNLQPPNPETEAIVERFNYFDLDLIKEFAKLPGNIFLSTASIKTTLALILEGAKGKSANQIENALRIRNIDQKEIREALNTLLLDLNGSTDNTILKSANSIFISNKYEVVPEYQKKVTKHYKGKFTKVDFANTNSAAKTINSWAYDATDGLIDNIVGSSLSPDTALILANALYFKGRWKTEFDPNGTKDQYFHSLTQGRVKVPMMQLSHTFNYHYNTKLDAHAVELPYQDDVYAMLILLPTNGMTILSKDVQRVQFNMVIDALQPTELILELPRFEIDYQTDLIELLKPFEIQEIFSPQANLSGMARPDNLKISNILHKAKIQVNEQGTKAAAVTTAAVVPLMGSTVQNITVDRPFLFFIYHKKSKNIIFEGLYAEPVQDTTPVKTATSNTKRTPILSPYGEQRFKNRQQ